MKFKTILNKVKQIAKCNGVSINDEDFRLEREDGLLYWFFTPYECGSGVKYEHNGFEFWWFVNADSYTIRFMESDFDMFDEIGKYLSHKKVDSAE